MAVWLMLPQAWPRFILDSPPALPTDVFAPPKPPAHPQGTQHTPSVSCLKNITLLGCSKALTLLLSL